MVPPSPTSLNPQVTAVREKKGKHYAGVAECMGESLGSLPAEGEEAALRMSIDRCPLRPLTDLGSHSLAVGVSVVCNSLRSTRLASHR